MPTNALTAAERVRLNQGKLEGLSTETLVRWCEHRPLAILDIFGVRRDIVRDDLAIYERGAGEESTATSISGWIVGRRSLAALEDLELWRVGGDAAILVGLCLEDAVKVKRHGFTSGG